MLSLVINKLELRTVSSLLVTLITLLLQVVRLWSLQNVVLEKAAVVVVVVVVEAVVAAVEVVVEIVAQYQVTDIAMSNRIVTFNVNGGGQEINLDVPNVPVSNVSVQKIIENGKVIILRDGQKFDILGNRL